MAQFSQAFFTASLTCYIWLLLKMITCAKAATSSMPYFTVHPQAQILLPRTRLTLNCTVSLGSGSEDGRQLDISSIKWLLNGSRLDSDQHQQKEGGSQIDMQSPSPNQSVLIIEKFHNSKDGVYQCLAKFIHPHAPAEQEISLLSLPASVTSASMPRMRKTPDVIVEVLENQTAVLSCDIPEMHPAPIVSFLMEKTPSVKLPHFSNKYYTSQQGTLQIGRVTHEDASHYRCVYTNPVGGHQRRSRSRIHLKVVKTPKNMATAQKLKLLPPVPQSTVRVLPGNNVTLECAASGIPPPLITWERYGGSLPASHEMILGNLHIVNFQQSDAGTYVCKATSGSEVVESIRSVELAETPRFLNDTSAEDLSSVYSNEPFSLQCPVTGNPLPSIQWFHNGLLLPSENDATFDVENAVSSHSGLYQCFLSSVYGSIFRTFQVRAGLQTTTTSTTTTATTTTSLSTTTTSPSTTTTPTTTTTTTTTTPTTTTETTTTTEPTTTTSTEPTTTTTDVTTTTTSERPDTTTSTLELVPVVLSQADVTGEEVPPSSTAETIDDLNEENETVGTTVQPSLLVVEEEPSTTTTSTSTVSTTPLWFEDDETSAPSLSSSNTDEFSELPDWMPDGVSDIDYEQYAKTAGSAVGLITTEYPTTERTTTTTLEPEVPTKKPKKGKKYNTTPRTRLDEYDEEEDEEEEIMIPPDRPDVERASDNSVMLKWEVPPNDGLEILYFKVQVRNMDTHKDWKAVSEVIPNDAREYRYTDTEEGASYRFRILAVFVNNESKAGKKSKKIKIPKRTGTESKRVSTDDMPVLTETAQVGLPVERMEEEEAPPVNQPEVELSSTIEPEPPVIVHVQSTANTLTVQWTPPMESVKGYYVHYKEAGMKTFTRLQIRDTSSNVYVIEGLRPETQYEIKMQSYTEILSDFSEKFDYATQIATVEPSVDPTDDIRSHNVTIMDAQNVIVQEIPVITMNSMTETTTYGPSSIFDFANSTQKSTQLLYIILGSVVGGLFLLVVIFAVVCAFRQKQLRKKNMETRFRNRLRSSSREFNKERMATLHTPAFMHPAFSSSVGPYVKGQSEAELDAMRPLSSPKEHDNDSEPETESVERSAPRSRKASPMDNHSLYHDPNESIYMPERTTDTFRRPSSCAPNVIAAWNDAHSDYSRTNTMRSVDYGRLRQQKLRSQTTPQAQLNYYE